MAALSINRVEVIPMDKETISLLAFILAMVGALPAATVGFCFWMLQQKLLKAEKEREKKEAEHRAKEKEREKLREQQELFLVQGVNAALALGEATAKAVQRIPDAHCNGDMHAALAYADKVKHEQRDFLAKQGIIQIYE